MLILTCEEYIEHKRNNGIVDRKSRRTVCFVTDLRWMIQQLREMTDVGKANRWLGFIQGVMAEQGLIKVPEEREFTRPYLTEK